MGHHTVQGVDEAIQILDQALGDIAEGRVIDSVLEGFEGW